MIVQVRPVSQLQRIEREDLYSQVVSRIVGLILRCEPGDRLPPEREITEELGVARSTVREAMRSLAFLGAVEPRRGDGVYVGRVDEKVLNRVIEMGLLFQKSKVSEIIEVRRLLETEAARLAACNRTTEDCETLRQSVANMNSNLGNLDPFTALDLEFHIAVSRAGHNSVLGYLINTLRGLLQMWIERAFSSPSIDMEGISVEHEAVCDAIIAGDPEKASSLMSVHLAKASERLLRVIGNDQLLEPEHVV